MIIEGWRFLDALYMTIITISTVGYREVNQVGDIGRLFTIFLVLIGVGFTFYVMAAVVQFMVEGRMRIIMGRRRLDKHIDRLKYHYIICGYGRIGRVLCRNLQRTVHELVVIEKDSDQVPAMDLDGVLYVTGDAGDEANLVKAGIKRAGGLVAALGTDTDNVFLVLSARQLAPELNIIARASHQGAKNKLRAAGANSVESPYEMGAASMAHRIIRPTVTSFLELPDQTIEVKVEEGNLGMGEGDSKVFLQKIEGLRYMVHGSPNDGLELLFEHDEMDRIKQIDLGTSVIPRYLTRSWTVIHATNPRLFDFVLDIESEKQAKAINNGMILPITSFEVEGQRIMGSFKATEPQETIGLPEPAPKYEVAFELMYIEDLLVGQIRISPEKSTVRVPGTLIILS